MVRARWRSEDLARMPDRIFPLGLDGDGLALAARLQREPRLGDHVSIACGIAASGFARGIGRGHERILQSGDVGPLRVRLPQLFDPARAGVAPRSLARLRIPKIVIPGMFQRLAAARDRDGVLLGRVYFVRPRDPVQRTMLLAFLNARLAAVLYRGWFAGVAQSGGYLRCNAPYLAALPLPAPRILPIELASTLAMLERAPSATLWRRLDAAIETSFGLDPTEIACVERLAKLLPPRPGEERPEEDRGSASRRRSLRGRITSAAESNRSAS
jgi:hypothetical protein